MGRRTESICESVEEILPAPEVILPYELACFNTIPSSPKIVKPLRGWVSPRYPPVYSISKRGTGFVSSHVRKVYSRIVIAGAPPTPRPPPPLSLSGPFKIPRGGEGGVSHRACFPCAFRLDSGHTRSEPSRHLPEAQTERSGRAVPLHDEVRRALACDRGSVCA